MKKDKKIIVFFLLVCLSQSFFSKYVSIRLEPFAFLQGFKDAGRGIIDVLGLCALSMPIIIILIFFSDFYSEYFEGYGRLLLVRNCNIRARVLKIYIDMFFKLIGLVFLETVIECFFSWDYLLNNYVQLLLYEIIYILIMFYLIILEFLIVSFSNETIGKAFANIYLFVSIIIGYYKYNRICELFILPSILACLKKEASSLSEVEFIFELVGMPIVLCIVIYGITVVRCKNKDIF